jgi:hypothetical protein
MKQPVLHAGLVVAALLLSGCGNEKTTKQAGGEKSEPAVSEAVSHDSTRRREKLPLADVVGSRACQECHPEEFDAWQQTGHAVTFMPAHEVPFLDELNGYRFHDKFRNVTYHYHVTGNDVEVSVPAVFGAERFPLQYAFGSGAHAISFLTLLPDVKGGSLGLEHRVSWYRETESFELTPKHEELPDPAQDAEMFGRIVHRDIVGDCIGCHVTTSDIVDGEVVNLEPNIGCESCHGPGRAHIEAVNAGHSNLRVQFSSDGWEPDDEIQVCGRCHRTIDDIPGPVIRADEMRIIRFQSVGLVQSRCYLESEKKLSCVTCHDPHAPADSPSTETFESKCLQCHGGGAEPDPDQTICPKSPKSGCIDCHLPKIEASRHVHFSDHWIRIRENDPQPARSVSQAAQ